MYLYDKFRWRLWLVFAVNAFGVGVMVDYDHTEKVRWTWNGCVPMDNQQKK